VPIISRSQISSAISGLKLERRRQPAFDLARDRTVDGPNQLWVADITYIAIATGFVYLPAILDAWSRRVVGYAISRSIDARVAVVALKAAI
jgi:putative transposase